MKRLCGILLALAGLFLYAPCAAQNTRVRGTVTDAQTGEPIPYAVVLFPGTTTGITTDDEGFYSLESRDTSSYIRAEMVSYEPQIRPVHVGGYNQIDFRLTPSHLEIESVVITPGDNPAHPILEGIIRNKKYNDSKEYDRYICRTYTKMELGLANIREFRSKKLQQNFGFIFEHLDTSSVTGQPYLPVMISETAADYYHSRTPSVAREVIRASQISGIEDNSVLAQFTGHLHADVNLYENFIDLFGVKFASPLSNSGRSFYKYFLVDSTNVEGRKTYKIRFHPKSVATPVLDGEVNIDSASYALRSARVKMAKGVNVNWIRHLAIEADNRLTADELTTVAGNMTLIGTTADEAKAPCEQMYFPKLQRIDGTLTLSRFDRLSGLGTTFGVLTQAGALRYEHLALANTFEFPLIETTGNITVTDCPILRSVLLPALTDAGSLEITGCPAIETLSFPKAERFDGDVSLATLPAIKDFGEFLPALKAISGDLSIDDLSSLEGVLDLSGCTFSPNSTLDLRLVAATRLTELRGGDFGGSLRIDASSLTPQPEAMPFEITGFKSLDTLRIAGFTHISALSLPTESCDDLTIENCGSQAPFTLSLPNLVEVRGTLLCRNCGKAGEANSASFPRLRNIGRQLSFYVGASSFTALEFPLLETIGNGEPVSDDPADDYALYTMPSGCAGEFILPSLQRVNGSMLVSTWNTSTDRAVAFRFPSLQSVAGEISVGHTAYKNRSVATLDFSALTAAGAIRIGNLSSVTDFSTFTQVLPRLSEQTWSVTDCGYNPTYQQMLDGETGAESK